jgi:hypothetical protein
MIDSLEPSLTPIYVFRRRLAPEGTAFHTEYTPVPLCCQLKNARASGVIPVEVSTEFIRSVPKTMRAILMPFANTLKMKRSNLLEEFQGDRIFPPQYQLATYYTSE